LHVQKVYQTCKYSGGKQGEIKAINKKREKESYLLIEPLN